MVGVVVGGTAVYLWHAQARPHIRPGTTVSLHDGQVTFRAPKGWRREACPSGSSGCVDFRPPGGAPGLRGDGVIAARSVGLWMPSQRAVWTEPS